jgi:hypothetical protein
MFAPKVAKPQAKVAESSARRLAPQPASLAARPFSGSAIEQALFLQRTIGNQATLQLLTRQTSSSAGNALAGGHETMTAQELCMRSAQPGLMRPKLAIGNVNGPLEHEAERVAEQVMRKPAPEIALGAAPPQISRKCAGSEAQEEEKLHKEAAVTDTLPGGAPASLHEVLRSAGQTLDAATRAYFEPRFRHDFSDVRVHTDGDAALTAFGLGAAAYTVETNIVFAPGRYQPQTSAGRRLLAHELAHVLQLIEQHSGSPPGPADGRERSTDAETAADRMAEAALSGLQLPVALAHPGSALKMQRQPDPFDLLRAGGIPSAGQSEDLLRYYATLAADQKDAVVRAFHQVGVVDSPLRRWLSALPKASLRGHRDVLIDIGQRLERYGAEQASGKTLTELGRAEAGFLVAEAEREARKEASDKAAKEGVTPPTTVSGADVARAHARTTEKVSPVTPPEAKTAWDRAREVPGGEAAWRARAAKAISAVVEACHRIAPELGITASNLDFAPEKTDGRGKNVFALSGDPLTIGMSFVETAEADPEYVVSVVVHEISGHPDYGPKHEGYGARIFAEAHQQASALGETWTFGSEHTYGYIGTETYAALREVPYYRELSAADKARGLGRSIPPDQNVANKIGLIKILYPAGVAEAVLQGLYERYRTDPRITDEALALFERKADEVFSKALKGVPQRGPRLTAGFGVGVGVEQAGGRSRLYGEAEANAVLRWATTTLGAGVRLEGVSGDRESFVRLGLQSRLHVQLFRGLYADLRGGYLWGLGSASSGVTAGGGVSYDFGPVQMGLIYDILKTTSDKDSDAHRALISLGLRL